nr:helix-turn-helix transcriptional regulator [uncultured Anaerotignum sp.]
MDIPTRNLGKYVRDRGINVTRMAEKTGIPYAALYDSLLNKSRERDLRVGEFFSICNFLGVDPVSFADKQAG